MKLSVEQVEHVAQLARLALTDDERTALSHQLSAILDAVDELAQVDTTGVPPTSVMGTLSPHERDDVVQGELGVEAALKNGPQVVGSSFAIPRVIE